MQKRARPTRFSPGVFSSLNRGAHGAQIAFLSRTSPTFPRTLNNANSPAQSAAQFLTHQQFANVRLGAERRFWRLGQTGCDSRFGDYYPIAWFFPYKEWTAVGSDDGPHFSNYETRHPKTSNYRLNQPDHGTAASRSVC